MSGFYTILEGCEGCGKTTIIDRLKMQYHGTEIDPEFVREPGSTPLAEHARSLVLSRPYEMNARAEALCFQMARASSMHSKVVPALEANRLVFQDRGTWSTIAYQGFGNKTDIFELSNIVKYAVGGVQADLIILLAIDPWIGLERTKARNGDKGDFMQNHHLDYHERVSRGFDFCYSNRYANPRHVCRIDASQDAETVWKAVLSAMKVAGLPDHLMPKSCMPPSGTRSVEMAEEG